MELSHSVCTPPAQPEAIPGDLAITESIRESLACSCLLCGTPLKGSDPRHKERGQESRPLFPSGAVKACADGADVELLSSVKACRKCKKSLKEEELYKMVVVSLFTKPALMCTYQTYDGFLIVLLGVH